MDILRSHILYIEDHEDTQELVTLVLAESNHRVTTTSSSKDALKLARLHQFDLYILDSWLADGTGIELCQRLREFDRVTPIMFFSAAAYETDKQAALDNGAQCYLVKPADIKVLRDQVNALIYAFRNNRDESRRIPRSHPSLNGGAEECTISLALPNSISVVS
ncbi:MAG TPA: response regulator [Pyrinomonadaceae bacterium]|nr:response regulator [Pyrinomonadaceae bacterium]